MPLTMELRGARKYFEPEGEMDAEGFPAEIKLMILERLPHRQDLCLMYLGPSWSELVQRTWTTVHMLDIVSRVMKVRGTLLSANVNR